MVDRQRINKLIGPVARKVDGLSSPKFSFLGFPLNFLKVKRMVNTELYEVFWPGGPSAVNTISSAPRADLTGKRIGILWDYVFRGEEIFPILEKSISERYENVEFIGYENFGSTFGGDEHAVLAALPKLLKNLKIDAVISGIGC